MFQNRILAHALKVSPELSVKLIRTFSGIS